MGRTPWSARVPLDPLVATLKDAGCGTWASRTDEGVRRLAAEVLPAQLTTARADVLEKFKPALTLAGHEAHGRSLAARGSTLGALLEVGQPPLIRVVGADVAAPGTASDGAPRRSRRSRRGGRSGARRAGDSPAEQVAPLFFHSYGWK